jgi:hypothetical protein
MKATKDIDGKFIFNIGNDICRVWTDEDGVHTQRRSRYENSFVTHTVQTISFERVVILAEGQIELPL